MSTQLSGNETAEPAEAAIPSKKALKKAQKLKEKADKAARIAEEEERRMKVSEANDTAKHLYGELEHGMVQDDDTTYDLLSLSEELVETEVRIEGRIHNSRMQSAKLCFLDIRNGCENIQSVVAEGGPNNISRNMVKWCGGLPKESIVTVVGSLKKPKDPVNSATISNFELHIKSCFVISKGPPMLPMQVKDAMQPPPLGEELEGQLDESGAPIVTLSTRL
jgi:aspartyl-tRNA synthetase